MIPLIVTTTPIQSNLHSDTDRNKSTQQSILLHQSGVPLDLTPNVIIPGNLSTPGNKKSLNVNQDCITQIITENTNLKKENLILKEVGEKEIQSLVDQCENIKNCIQ